MKLVMPTLSRSKPIHQHGLSLVELMVAMTIGLLITAAIGYIYLGSRQTFRTVDDFSRIQENYRYALDQIGVDVRNAGFSGCVNVSVNPAPGVPAGVLAPAAHVLRQSIQGYPGGAVWPGPAPAPANYVANTEVLRIVASSGQGTNVTAPMAGAATAIAIADNPAGFAVGSALVISDCTHADVFDAGAVGGTTSVTPAATLQKPYSTGAEVYPLVDTVYFIGNNVAGNPSLYRRQNNSPVEELVENVENMVLRYGVDTTNDFAVDSYQAVAGVADWQQVVSTRVNLVFVSNNAVAAGVQPCIVEGADCSQADGLLRQVATATYGLRNRLP
jgi:type IV pilus assembly protein PilW